MASRRKLIEAMYEVLKAREQPDDADVPTTDGPLYYEGRFRRRMPVPPLVPLAGAGRRCGEGSTIAAPVILDEPSLASAIGYFRARCACGIRRRTVAGMACRTGTSGAERFTLRVKDLDTGKRVHDVHPRNSGSRRKGRRRLSALPFRRRRTGLGVSGAPARHLHARSIRRRCLRREPRLRLLLRRFTDPVENIRGDPNRGSRDVRVGPDRRGRSVPRTARSLDAPHRTRVPPQSSARPFRHQDQR